MIQLFHTPSTDTVFQHSKVIEIRNKYVVENLTGMDIEIKQVGLPDIEDLQGILRSDQLARLRNRRVIPNGGAAPLVRLRAAPKSKGDKVELASEICIRPDDGEWEWSGQYTPEEKEQYFGMRLIHKVDKDKFLILPVTVSVGKGTVLVSLQSATSVPPYRLSNVCSSLKVKRLAASDSGGFTARFRFSKRFDMAATAQIYFIQEGIYSDSQPVDRRGSLNPGSSLDYAFDEPMLPHRIVLAAMSPSGKLVASAIDMDRVGHTQVWILPASAPVTQSDRQDAEDPEMARRRTELQRMASKHLNKKIYLEVYADGPTRTLRISETKGYSQEREVHQIVDLATDIRQLGTLLRNLNRQFIAVFGTQDGARQIDMYGRSLDKHGYTIMDHGFSAQEQREGLSRLSYSTAKAGPMAAVQPIPDANRTVNPGQQAMIEDEAGPSHPHGRYRQRKAIKTVKGKAPEVTRCLRNPLLPVGIIFPPFSHLVLRGFFLFRWDTSPQRLPPLPIMRAAVSRR